MILPLCCLLWHLATPAWAQETLSLKECREMALKYNKEMAASVKQTESARYTAKSYKGNFFPNFTVSGTGLYSNADGSYGIVSGGFLSQLLISVAVVLSDFPTHSALFLLHRVLFLLFPAPEEWN